MGSSGKGFRLFGSSGFPGPSAANQGVNLVLLAPQLEDLQVGLGENVGNLLLLMILMSLSLLL